MTVLLLTKRVHLSFFEKLNPHVEILRPDTHTIPLVLSRCPLLFTVSKSLV